MSIAVSPSEELSVLLLSVYHPHSKHVCAQQDFGKLRVGLVQSSAARELPRR